MSLARGRYPLVHEDRKADSVLGLAVQEGNYGKKGSCILCAARSLSGCVRIRSRVPVGDHRLGVVLACLCVNMGVIFGGNMRHSA